jgi:transposase-like protein
MAQNYYLAEKSKMEIVEMLSKYKTQKKCIEFLEKARWENKPICPYCGSERSSVKTQEYRHKCHDCGRSYSVLVGTIFESTKLPLTKWFATICLILNAKKGISSLQLSRDVGVNKNTAWFLQKRIRQAMQDNDFMLKGIVEIDETYVGGSLSNKHYFTKLESGKYHKTGMEHKVPVLGMIEREGKIILKVLEKASGKDIRPFVKSKIEPNSIIVTDGFGGYTGLKEHFDKHVILNHSQYERGISQFNTCTLEGFWTLIKRSFIGQYHKISREHLQDYLNELAFKHNNKNANMFILLINNLLQQKYAFI